jgi:Flp pilus assembly pilin Flp
MQFPGLVTLVLFVLVVVVDGYISSAWKGVATSSNGQYCGIP